MKRLGKCAALSALLVVGCNTGRNGTHAAASASATPKAPASAAPVAKAAVKPRLMHARHAGIVGDFLATARTLDLKAEQKTKLADIDKQVMAMPADAKKAFGDFHDAIVAGIKAGKIDKAKLDPLYTQFDKVTEEHQKTQADALNSLYALLEPAQRKTLVAAIQKQQAAREARWAKKKGMAADKTKAKDWQQQWAKHRLDRMTKMLDLDADQQKKIEPLLTKEKMPAGTKQDRMAAKKKQMDAVLAAFDKDGFDATKLDLGGMGAKDRRAHLDQRVQFLNALLPILKPEQRTKFAGMMHAMRGPGMMGRPGMHPGMMRGHGMRRGPGMMHGPGMGMGPAMGPGYRWGGPPIQLPFDQEQGAGQPAAPSAPAAPAAK